MANGSRSLLYLLLFERDCGTKLNCGFFFQRRSLGEIPSMVGMLSKRVIRTFDNRHFESVSYAAMKASTYRDIPHLHILEAYAPAPVTSCSATR
jgi:hypothetical protein